MIQLYPIVSEKLIKNPISLISEYTEIFVTPISSSLPLICTVYSVMSDILILRVKYSVCMNRLEDTKLN